MRYSGRIALVAARLLLPGWCGAAILFVMASVAEVTSPQLDSTTKDILAGIRFPMYYVAGAACLGGGLLSVVIATVCQALPRRAGWVSAGLLVVALGLMAYDYVQIFRPLMEMITPPGSVRPAEFQPLHEWSARINGVELLCVMAAALCVAACGPVAKNAND